MSITRLVSLSLALVAAQPALAGTVRVDFSGSVTDLFPSDEFDPVAALGGSIGVGTRFSGHFTFDDSAAPVWTVDEVVGDPAYAAFAEYRFSSPTWSLETEIGGYGGTTGVATPLLPTGGYQAYVYDYELNPDPSSGSTIQVFGTVGEAPSSGTDYVLSYAELTLEGSDLLRGPLHSTSMAGIPWNLQAFAGASGSWFFVDGAGDSVGVAGNLDQLTVTPEPGSAGLVGLGCLALAALGFRRGRS